jgi:hypothetical protein
MADDRTISIGINVDPEDAVSGSGTRVQNGDTS